MDNRDQELKEIKQSLARIEYALNGNGAPGIKTRLALLENWSSSIKRLSWLMIGCTFTAVGSALTIIITTAIGALR